MHKFDKSIFREYDIRGIVSDTLNLKDAYYIGYNFGKQIKDKFSSNTIVIGFDGRLSSPIIEKNLIEGLFDAGANIIRVGLCSSPMLYFSQIKLKADGAIMITGSHNPSNYNGFKILSKEESYYGKKIISLSKIKRIKKLKGQINNYNIKNTYIRELVNAIKDIKENLKVVWDAGNGSTGELLTKLVKHIPGKHVLINSEIDGTFPAHHPDPTEEKNLKQIKNKIAEENADLGIAFDGDGDRIGVVDSKGNLISGDKLLLLYATDLLRSQKGASIIGDVKASNIIFDEIDSLGGKPIMWKTGHSLIKAKMKETGSILAGEMSGHIFFADKYYGFDDAMYAAIRLLNIISNNFNMIKFLEKFKGFFSTPEIKVYCNDREKFKIIKKIHKEITAQYEDINLIDGVRVNLKNGWWLIRASNTQPAIILRCESNSQKGLLEILNKVSILLSNAGLEVKDLL